MPKNYSQQGVIVLALPVLFIAIILVILYILISQGIFKSPINIPGIFSKQPTVTLKTNYSNPFDSNSQYVNPFNSYKNPFDNLK